ncbi:MAG: PKD domain-containing protein [Candidatus Brocadia sp.]|nr:MAG: PKD domain-containing protein [Candidatus Brocadia sp.]
MMVKLKSFNNGTLWIKYGLWLMAIVFCLSLYALCVLGQSVEGTPGLEIDNIRGRIQTGNAFYYQPSSDDTSTARKQGQPSGHQDALTPEYFAVDRATWDLTPYANKTGQIRVVDESAGDGRHKNSCDFGLLAQSRKFRFDKILIPPDDRKIAIPSRDDVRTLPEIKLFLSANKDHLWERETARFEVRMSPPYRNIRYQFNFGDGTENIRTTKPVIDHVYYKKGTYRVFVSVILNDRSYTSNLITINVDKSMSRPVAKLRPEYLAVVQGEKALFESQSTYETDVPVKEFWSGPGDQKATGRMFEIDTNQLQPRRYEIVLNIIDNYKQSDRTTAILEVLPSVKYTVVLDANYHRIEQNQVLKLKASLTPDIQNEEYRFNFGDGTESAWAISSMTEHVYLLPGIYRAFVAVRSKDQILATSNVIQIEVTSKIVYTVFLEADKKNLFITESVNFTGNIQPVRERVLYQFDFGDGMRSDWLQEPETSHRYSNSGIYDARLTAKIGDELIRSNNVTITVDMASIKVFLEAEPTHIEPDQTVTFRANHEPTIEKVEYRFIFGDGGVRDWSHEAMAEHIYSEPGNYHAYVVSRIDQKNVSESNPVIVRITRHSQGRSLWVGISAGLFALFGGGGYVFLRMKRLRKTDKHFKQTIQVRPHKDMGLQHIESDVSVQTGFEVQLKSVLDSGKQDIETKDHLIIEEQEEP